MEEGEDGVWRFEDKGEARTVHGHAASSDVVEEGVPDALHVGVRGLPDAIDTVVYSFLKWPLVVDPEGTATLWLKYTGGAFILATFPAETQPSKLRRNLVGCLRHGSSMVFNFADKEDADVESFVEPGCVPPEIRSRTDIFREEVWAPLLREDEGDPPPREFMPRDEFKVIVVTRCNPPPPALTGWTVPIHVGTSEGAGEGTTAEDVVAQAFGAEEVKRNSEEMVESAFDGDLEEVQRWVEKGYSFESEDGHQHTPLSEASAQGHPLVVKYLLGLGADPNAANDQGRSPLWRAAFNGHAETVSLLLESGADPDAKDRQTREVRSVRGGVVPTSRPEQSPVMVAKTDEIRALLEGWDRARTEELRSSRDDEIRRRAEERIRTAAEREQLARDRIRRELVDLARDGSADDLREALQRLADDADNDGDKLRGGANCRDERGTTLLGIAAWHGREETLRMLLSHWRSFDTDPIWDNSRKAFRASINARDMRGWTPASIAAFHGQKQCLRALLEAGADPSIPNQYGKTAAEVAKDEEIRELLVAFGAAASKCECKEGKPEKGSVSELQVEVGKAAAHSGNTKAPKKSGRKGTAAGAAGKPRTGGSSTAKGSRPSRGGRGASAAGANAGRRPARGPAPGVKKRAGK